MDFSKLTLRQLLTVARERLGSAAAALKTREEVLAALASPAISNEKLPEAEVPVVTRDFFRSPDGEE